MNFKLKQFLLATSSGLLFWLAWPTFTTTFLIFFAFVPLLYAEHLTTEAKKKGFWIYSYWAMLLWNAGTTWWIYNSTVGGGIFAVVANAAIMTVPFAAFRKTKEVFGPRLGYMSLLIYFIGFEYLHLNWDISWPWITLGNVFALRHTWVQWYEYTGILGGSIWVLLTNVIVFYQLVSEKQSLAPRLIKVGAVIGIPLLFSAFVFMNVQEDGKSISIISVQPNINPYGDKFTMPVELQLEQLTSLTEQAFKQESADVVLWPETAIQGSNREATFKNNEHFQSIKQLIEKHPNSALLTGLESWEKVPAESNAAYTKFSTNIGHYQKYNTGVWLTTDTLQLYHKSKFVPGVECIPFPKVLGFFKDIIDFSAAGTYAPQSHRPIFKTVNNLSVAPIICYESIYGDFLRDYVTQGVDLLSIITNDGWWGNTQGHKHHALYAKLRAIEFRRPVARSANTGISCFIDIKGNMIQQSDYWVPDVLTETLTSSSKVTFFAKHGAYLGRFLSFLAVVLFLSTLVRKKTKDYT